MPAHDSPPAPEARWREIAGGGATIRLLAAGSGPPLVLLHGLACSARWWRRNLGALSRRFQVLALDYVQPAGPPPHSFFSLEGAAPRLAAWMADVGLRRANVIGHSMGGRIAAELAAGFPHLVDRLVLVDPAALFPKGLLKVSPAAVLRSARYDLPLGLASLLLQDAFRTGPRSIWSSVRALLTADLRSTLSRITAPTLLIWGGRDGLLPVRLAGEVARWIPHCQRMIFPESGHNPMWDNAERFNAAVEAFLTAGKP